MFEAFACPSGLDPPKLADAYTALGRPDLAKAAVDQKYRRLSYFIAMGGYWYDRPQRCSTEMSGLLAQFAVSDPPETAAEWEDAAYERHKDSPQLQALLARNDEDVVKKKESREAALRYQHRYHRAFLKRSVAMWERGSLRKKEEAKLT